MGASVKYTVVTLGEVPEETSEAINRLMHTLAIYDYEVANYALRKDDVENTIGEAASDHGIRPSKSYLRWRLTNLLKRRLRYKGEPPFDLDDVVAVVYDPAHRDDEQTPHWDLVASAFCTSVYQIERTADGGISLAIVSVAA